MKTLVIVLVLFSQGLFASDKIDFGKQITTNIKSKQSLETTYQTSLEKINITDQEKQLVDYVKHELEFEAPEVLVESDSKEKLKE